MNILSYRDAFYAALETVEPKTDLEIGRFIAKNSQTDDRWISYRTTSPTRGEWFVWNGKVHALEPANVDDHLARAYIDAFNQRTRDWQERGMSATEVQKRRNKANKWSSTTAMRYICSRIREEVRVAQNHFDTEKRWIAMRDGSVLDTIFLEATPLPPDPKRPITRHLGVCFDDYEPQFYIEGNEQVEVEPHLMTARQLQEWLDEFLPDTDEQRMLQEAMGAALLGEGSAKNIIVLEGPKNTGKSTVTRIGHGIFGERDTRNGYAGLLPHSAIVRSSSGANFAQAHAKGTRLLTMSEPPTKNIDENFLKNLAGGGEPVVTENKGRDPEEWYPECVLFLSINSSFVTKDKALNERLNVLEFIHKITTVDDDFVDKLIIAEGGLILKWVIQGALRYRERGYIEIPQTVKDRAEAQFIESSSVLRWLAEMVEEGKYVIDTSLPRVRYVNAATEYSNYSVWCSLNNERPAKRPDWQREIHAAHNAPADAMKRSKGILRLFGVQGAEGAPGVHLGCKSEVAEALIDRSF